MVEIDNHDDTVSAESDSAVSLTPRSFCSCEHLRKIVTAIENDTVPLKYIFQANRPEFMADSISHKLGSGIYHQALCSCVAI